MFRPGILKVGNAIKTIERFVDPDELLIISAEVGPSDQGILKLCVSGSVTIRQVRAVVHYSGATYWSLELVATSSKFDLASAKGT